MYYDRVLDTTTTTGTGPWTLADVALPTFRRPSDVLSNGDTILGVLEAYDDDGTPLNEWIAGVFQYASSGPTLTALEIYSGSNGTSAVSFSAGVKRFMSAEPAARIGPTISDGKDADTRPTYPRRNDQYIATDAGKVYRFDGTDWTVAATSNTGTVTSVGLTMPSLFAVDKSPVTTSGTIAVTLASQTKATFLAAPTAEDGAPTARVIAAGDLPSTVAFLDGTAPFTKAQTFEADTYHALAKGGTLLNKYNSTEYPLVHVGTQVIDEGEDFSPRIEVGSFVTSSGNLAAGLSVRGTSGTLAGIEVPVALVSGLADIATSGSWGDLLSVPANVDAFGNLVSVADSLPYFTDSGKMALATYTVVGRSLDALAKPAENSWPRVDSDGKAALRTASETRGDLGGTTIGIAGFTQTNPSAVGFNRTNADNTLTHRTPSQVVGDINVVVSESGSTGTISDSTHRGRTVLFTNDAAEWEAPTGLTEGFICSLFPPIGKTLELTAGAGATVQAAGTTVGQNGAVLFWVAANTYRLSGDVS